MHQEFELGKNTKQLFIEALASTNNVLFSIVHPTWIRTPLIEELIRQPGFNDPVLEPETVADAVVAQVIKGESAQILLTGRAGLVLAALRGLPHWMQEGARNMKAQTMRRTLADS